MRVPAAFVLFAPVVFCLAALEARAGRFVLFERSWGDCIVVTDMTDAGRALKPASRENPVYYLGESIGCRLGSMNGDRLPDSKEMGRFVAKILAKHGYLAAQPGVHEPELFLVLQWGRLAATPLGPPTDGTVVRPDPSLGERLWFLGYNPRDDIAAPTLAPGVLGPEVWRRDMRSREIETVLDFANGDIYGIIISAFEYKSAHTRDPVVLWQTRIGLAANGKGMPEAIVSMAQVAGPQIGRETVKPVLRNMDDRYTTRLGELEVIGFVDDESSDDAGREGQR